MHFKSMKTEFTNHSFIPNDTEIISVHIAGLFLCFLRSHFYFCKGTARLLRCLAWGEIMTQWSLLYKSSGVRVTKDGMTHMYAARSHSVKINLKEFFFILQVKFLSFAATMSCTHLNSFLSNPTNVASYSKIHRHLGRL